MSILTDKILEKRRVISNARMFLNGGIVIFVGLIFLLYCFDTNQLLKDSPTIIIAMSIFFSVLNFFNKTMENSSFSRILDRTQVYENIKEYGVSRTFGHSLFGLLMMRFSDQDERDLNNIISSSTLNKEEIDNIKKMCFHGTPKNQKQYIDFLLMLSESEKCNIPHENVNVDMENISKEEAIKYG